MKRGPRVPPWQALEAFLTQSDLVTGNVCHWEAMVNASNFGGSAEPSTDPWVCDRHHRADLSRRLELVRARKAFFRLDPRDRDVLFLAHHDAPNKVPRQVRRAAYHKCVNMALVACYLEDVPIVAEGKERSLTRWFQHSEKRFRDSVDAAKAAFDEAFSRFSEHYRNGDHVSPNERGDSKV